RRCSLSLSSRCSRNASRSWTSSTIAECRAAAASNSVASRRRNWTIVGSGSTDTAPPVRQTARSVRPGTSGQNGTASPAAEVRVAPLHERPHTLGGVRRRVHQLLRVALLFERSLPARLAGTVEQPFGHRDRLARRCRQA